LAAARVLDADEQDLGRSYVMLGDGIERRRHLISSRAGSLILASGRESTS
jgi:hypothetical protein